MSWIVILSLLLAASAAAQDCNRDGISDPFEIAAAAASDCNANGLPDQCDLGILRLAMPTAYTVGEDPVASVVADLDADGQRDVAVVSERSHEVASFFGAGDGTMRAGEVVYLGFAARAIVAGDIDGDGTVDLVTATPEAPAVTVLLNEGDGTLAPPMHLAANPSPTGVAAADLDGDGDLDLAACDGTLEPDTAARIIALLINDGAGGFSRPLALAAGSAAAAIVAQDLNADGRPDLAVAEDFARVSVLLNQGGLEFSRPVHWPIEGNGEPLIAADVDGDGTVDLVTGGGTVLFNDGNASFTPETVPGLGERSSLSLLGAADLDSDSLPDLVVSEPRSDEELRILRNLGDRRFAPPLGFGVPNVSGVSAGDLDGDGRVDLVAVNGFAGSQVSVVLNGGNGVLMAPRNLRAGISPADVAIGDWDGDRDADLAIVNRGTNDVSILKNRGDAIFATELGYVVGIDPLDAAAGDFDGDGDLDLVTADFGRGEGTFDVPAPPTLSLLRNRGDGTFGLPEQRMLPLRPDRIETMDFEGDGDLDLAVSGVGSFPSRAGTVVVFVNDGSGGFTLHYLLESDRATGPLASGDFDADGDVDLVAGLGLGLTVLRNVQDGIFVDTGFRTVLDGIRSLASGDFDGDGALDLVVAGGNSFSLLWNGGDAEFEQAMTRLDRDPQGVSVGDYDGDGRLDVAVSTLFELSLFRNRGRRFFEQQLELPTERQEMLGSGDLDGDGRDDLIAGLQVFLSQSIPPVTEDENLNDVPDECEPRFDCLGDCDGDFRVSLAELLRGVRIGSGALALLGCPSFDHDRSDAVTIDELVRAVDNAIFGCADLPSSSEARP